jgi:hypothetical protein
MADSAATARASSVRGWPTQGAGALLPHPTHDLDILPRHRLLRQPGGFEGFNAVKKQCVGQAIAEVQALVELKLNLNDRRRS